MTGYPHMIGAVLIAAVAALPAAAKDYPAFDPAKYSQEVTDCDRYAGHKEDPHKVVPGLSESGVDLAKAIPACEAAVAADPDNPRLNYQMGRVYGYSGQVDKATPYRIKASEAGYPQSLFTYGFISLTGYNAPKDVCLGGELLRASAIAGRFAGQVGFPHYVLTGEFDDCDNVKIDWDEMLDLLDTAMDNKTDYYQELLILQLSSRIQERQAAAAKP